MLRKYQRFVVFSILFLFGVGLNNLSGQVNQNGLSIIYDTVIVYDIIPVYDTIWEYETVYDTLWVINPGEVDSSELHRIEPISVRRVFYSPLNRDVLVHGVTRKIELSTPIVNKKWKEKVRKELKKLKDGPNPYRSNGSKPPMLTLNPSKGRFDPHAFINGTFSLEGYWGLTYQLPQLKYNEQALQIQHLNDSMDWLPGREYGVRLNYSIFQLTLQTGIGLTQLNEKLNYTEFSWHVDSTPHLIPNPDSLIFDSVRYYTYDSAVRYIPRASHNSHRYLEIPMIFSYGFFRPRSEITIKIGAINQFHIGTTGKMFNGSDTVKVIDRINHYTKYNLAAYAGLGYVYSLTNQLKFCADLYYKYPLKADATGLGVVYFIPKYGVNFAIRYRF